MGTCPHTLNRDSLTQTDQPIILLNGGPGGDKKITGHRWGKLCELNVKIGSKVVAAWGKETLVTLPAGWRPNVTITTAMSGRDNGNQMNLVIYTDGRVAYENQGGTQASNAVSVSVCYLTI